MQSSLIEKIESTRASIPRTLMLIGESASASWQWRVEWPCRALSDHGYVADWCLSQYTEGILPLINKGRFNVLVAPRAHWNSIDLADQWVRVMHDFGLALVYELDDDGWSPDIVQRQQLFEREYQKGAQRLEEERLERIHIIKQFDGVIVSSEGLAKVARSYTDRPVFCVPNMIRTEWFEERMSDAKRVLPPLTIGWSGGLRDENDLANVATAWGRLAKRYPQITFVVHGVVPSVLTNSVPADRLKVIGWSTLPDYPRALMNLDIACCAVEANVGFNLAKTAIKWYETTLAGAACVVTPTLYGPEVRDGHNALVAETPDQWEDALSRLIEQPLLRKRLNRNARRAVAAEHSLDNGWARWVDALGQSLQFYQEGQRDERAA